MKKLILLFLVFSILGMISAASQVVSVNYESLGKISYQEVSSSSIILKVTTPNATLCRYNSVNENFSFASGNDFSLSFNNVSEVTFTGLSSGVHNYHVKCYSGDSSSITVSLLINPPITGKVVLSETEPLKSGKADVTLVTSKSASSVPGLKYSFDGIVYNPLTLVGSGTTWKGYLIIDDGIGEGLVSFKMDATDLEGKSGSEITGGAVYAIDTIKPKTVSAINAEGYNGGIELRWHLDEEYDHFNIYRSESANVAYTDLYQDDIDEDDYRDTSVVTGKTYYYKVSAIDEAGNEGDLSIEVYAAPTSTGSTSSLLGLALNLQGKVDSLLNEIDFATSEVQDIQTSISYKAGKEKELFSLMKLDSEVDNAIAQLNSLRRDAEKYKQQDLSKDSLEQKIASSELKIESIKRKIPEDITILKEGSSRDSVDEDKLREAIISSDISLDESEIEKSVKKSIDLSEEKGFSVESGFYVVQVLYSDGSKKTFSIVKRDLNSQFAKGDDGNFLEVIPKEVIESASYIMVRNQNYGVVKDDPILSFGPDEEEIIYYFEGDSEIDSLKETFVNFVSIAKNDDTSSITGYFSLGVENKKSTGIVLAGVLILCVGGYLFYRRRNGFSDSYFNLLRRIKETDGIIGKVPLNSIESEYSLIRGVYNSLSQEEKNSIYSKVEKLRDKVFVLKLEEGLGELRKTWDKNLFLKMEKIYNSMTEKSKKKLGEVFLQVKRDVELKEMEARGKNNLGEEKKETSGEKKQGDGAGEKEEKNKGEAKDEKK